jgi:hypothetical protein
MNNMPAHAAKQPLQRPLDGGARTARVLATALLAALGVLATPAQALTFNLSYDSSVTNAPAGFQSAFQNAISFYETNFTSPVTVNLSVGWGEVGGTLLNGALGSSLSYTMGASYSQVSSALSSLAAPGFLPALDPTGGRTISVNLANAKALGLAPHLPRNQLDGSVGFSDSASWAFDPNQRAQAGAYDFIGVAMHEVGETLGRISMLTPGCSGSSCSESVLDLFRYTAPGTLDLSGTNAYFSLNGGVTSLNTFHGNASTGDLGDWAGQTVDAFNYAAAMGQELPFSAGDLQVMASLGYGLAAPVPEPSESAFMLAGLGILGWRFGARRKAA